MDSGRKAPMAEAGIRWALRSRPIQTILEFWDSLPPLSLSLLLSTSGLSAAPRWKIPAQPNGFTLGKSGLSYPRYSPCPESSCLATRQDIVLEGQFVFSTVIQALRAAFPPHHVCKGGWCGEKGVKPLLGLPAKGHVQSSPKGIPLESSRVCSNPTPQIPAGPWRACGCCFTDWINATVGSALTWALPYCKSADLLPMSRG